MRGAKHAVLKNPGDLTDRQSATLDGIRNTDPRAGSTVHGNSRNY